MSSTYCRISRSQPKAFLKLFHDLFAQPHFLAPSYDKLCVCICAAFCVGGFLTLYLLSAWRRDVGGWVSYSGKQRLKLLSKHCQKGSWAQEKDLLMLLWVLSEVTRWRLWFLFWPLCTGQHHPDDCHAGSKMFFNCCTIISSTILYFHFLQHVVMVCSDCHLFTGCLCSTSWRLPEKPQSMLFFL